MAPAFTAETRTLAELLRNPNVLQVPDYQRAFSWTTKEAGQLIDDLMVANAETADPTDQEAGYFLGAVLLMAQPPSGAKSIGSTTPPLHCFDIVDGQQRLITLTILLAVIRDICHDRGASIDALVEPMLVAKKGLRIVPRGRERVFLETFVQRRGAALDMPPDDDLSEGEQRILAVREHFLSTLIELDAADLARLAGFLANACHFAVVTTRTIDRAHRIFSVLNERGRPLARNDILKAQILGGLPVAERSDGARRWDVIEARLGGSFEDLFSHIRTIESRGRVTIITGIGGVIEACGGPLPFFREYLEPYADIFAQIRDGSAAAAPSPQVARYLRYLGWLGSSEWIPPLMLFWRRCNGDTEHLEAFLARYDRLAFGLRLLGIGADKRLARYSSIMSRLREGGRLEGPDNPLEFTREETRNILYNLRGLHARSQLTCKLLLMRLNDEIAGAPQSLEPGELTVEHVLPQKPGRNSQWRVWYPLADERETCTQSLGNLTLVTRDQNDKARNMELPRKLAVYFSGAEPLHITRDLKALESWRREQILEREQRFQVLIHRLWGFEAARAASEPQAAGARR